MGDDNDVLYNALFTLVNKTNLPAHGSCVLNLLNLLNIQTSISSWPLERGRSSAARAAVLPTTGLAAGWRTCWAGGSRGQWGQRSSLGHGDCINITFMNVSGWCFRLDSATFVNLRSGDTQRVSRNWAGGLMVSGIQGEWLRALVITDMTRWPRDLAPRPRTRTILSLGQAGQWTGRWYPSLADRTTSSHSLFSWWGWNTSCFWQC